MATTTIETSSSLVRGNKSSGQADTSFSLIQSMNLTDASPMMHTSNRKGQNQLQQQACLLQSGYNRTKQSQLTVVGGNEKVRPVEHASNRIVPTFRSSNRVAPYASLPLHPNSYGSKQNYATRHHNRSVSDTGDTRRSIFGQFWSHKQEKAELKRTNSHPESEDSAPMIGNLSGLANIPEIPARRRSASVSLPLNHDSNHSNASNPSDLRFYGPSHQEIWEFMPPERGPLYNGDHLKSIEDLPNIHCHFALPELPSPLQRLRKHSGVYPLKTPQSILRVHKTKNKEMGPSESEGASLGQKVKNAIDIASSSSISTSSSTSLSDPISQHPSRSNSDTKLDDNGSKASSSGSHVVHFDPRVTVTEFEDVKRLWFSDKELEGFKYETILLVKQYLMKHPEAIAEYNTPVLDPVTGTMRKKALFSMPVLGSGEKSPEAIECENEMLNVIKMQDINRLAHLEVRSILIVDRNKLIRELFQRSLKVLFPHAKCVTAESGEEALHLVRSALASNPHKRGFDIVISEERLYIPLMQSPGVPTGHKTTIEPKGIAASNHLRGKSCNDLASHQQADLSAVSLTPIHDSNDSLPPVKYQSQHALDEIGESWNGFSGSELFQRIMQIEQADSTSPRAEASALETAQCWSSLLIGVSTHPHQEAKHFVEHGADIVWGKPPPTMNRDLRNEIVMALIKKRKASV